MVSDINPRDGLQAIENPHAGLLAIDTHVDIPWPEGPSPFEDGPRCVDLPKLRQGGVAAVCFVAYVPQSHRDAAGHLAAAGRTRAMLHTIAAMAPPDGSGGILTRTADEIEAAYAAGKPGIIPAIENGYGIGRDLSLLDEFADLGARYITLTHNGHNEIGDAAIPRSEEHTSELQSLPTISYAVFCLRSEERRVGKECYQPCRSRWSPYH